MLTKTQVLTTDLSKTEDIDPVKLREESTIEYFEDGLAEAIKKAESEEDEDKRKKIEAGIVEFRETIAEKQNDLNGYVLMPDAEKMIITIGFLPPSKLSEIRSGLAECTKKDADGKEILGEDGKRVVDIDATMEQRCLLCRWGIRGYEQGVFEKEKVHGRPRPVLSWDSIEVLYFNKLIVAISDAILEYNTLSSETKKK